MQWNLKKGEVVFKKQPGLVAVPVHNISRPGAAECKFVTSKWSLATGMSDEDKRLCRRRQTIN